MNRLLHALSAVLLAMLASTAFATTYRFESPETLVLKADVVFFGSVTSATTAGKDGQPWTTVTFGDLTVLRDRAATEAGEEFPSSEVLDFLGGTAIGLPTLQVSGLPTFAVGERWLILAYQADGMASPLAGVAQGAWKLSSRGALAFDGSYLDVDPAGALVRGASSPSEAELVTALTALLQRGVENSSAAPTVVVEPAPTEAPSTDQQAATPAAEAPASETPPAQEPPAEQPPAEPSAPAPNAATPPTAQPPAQVITYSVSDEGGPLLLSAAAATAANAWEVAAPGAAAFAVSESATNLIRYGAADLMGPDATSLTLASSGGRTEVVVSPLAGDLVPAVLLHELGVLLGLQEGGEGVMAWTVSAATAAPTPQDVTNLRDLRTYLAEDLDRSGRVDFYDLVIFGQAFGATGINLAADLDGNGKVDGSDLKLLREAYEFAPPQENAPN